jgi:hypothetical protein
LDIRLPEHDKAHTPTLNEPVWVIGYWHLRLRLENSRSVSFLKNNVCFDISGDLLGDTLIGSRRHRFYLVDNPVNLGYM